MGDEPAVSMTPFDSEAQTGTADANDLAGTAAAPSMVAVCGSDYNDAVANICTNQACTNGDGCADSGVCYSLPQVECPAQQNVSENEDESTGAASPVPYVNPQDNTFFCGQTFESTSSQCLTSKPCPSGSHSSCPGTDGCYDVLSCTTEYDQEMTAVKPVPPMVSPQDATQAMTYDNPQGSRSFCGLTTESIEGQCLASKPCPGGSASTCPGTERCYIVPSCTAEYEAAAIATVVNAVCELCDSPNIIDWSKRVDHEGSEISCGDFNYIFSSDIIVKGSDRCANFRAQYSYQCCGEGSTQESFAAGQVPASFSSPASTAQEPAPDFEAAWYSPGMFSHASTVTVSTGLCLLSIATGMFFID